MQRSGAPLATASVASAGVRRTWATGGFAAPPPGSSARLPEHHGFQPHGADRCSRSIGLGATRVGAHAHADAPTAAGVQLLAKRGQPFVQQPRLRLARIGLVCKQPHIDVVARRSSHGGQRRRGFGLSSRGSGFRRPGFGWRGCAAGGLGGGGCFWRRVWMLLQQPLRVVFWTLRASRALRRGVVRPLGAVRRWQLAAARARLGLPQTRRIGWTMLLVPMWLRLKRAAALGLRWGQVPV